MNLGGGVSRRLALSRAKSLICDCGSTAQPAILAEQVDRLATAGRTLKAILRDIPKTINIESNNETMFRS